MISLLEKVGGGIGHCDPRPAPALAPTPAPYLDIKISKLHK